MDRPTTSVWLRAEVKNRGRAEARNVRAVVEEWYERPDSRARCKRQDLDPSAPHWVSLPWGRREHADHTIEARETTPVVNLPRGLSDFVDLISYDWKPRKHTLALDTERPRGFVLNPSTTEGEFVLTVLIVADNAKSLTKHIYYAVSREKHLTEVWLQAGPPPDAQFSPALRAEGNDERDSPGTTSGSPRSGR